VLDFASIGVIVVSLIWTLIRIYETDTVRHLVQRWRGDGAPYTYEAIGNA
jgi:hypothetical protein